MTSGRRIHAAALAGALALASCSSADEGEGAGTAASPAPGSTGVPLATVGERVITTGDAERRLERLSPYERARYTSIDQKRELVDNMIRAEVLAQEAFRRGFDEHPDVVRAVKELMIQRMMEDLLATEVDPHAIPEDELRAYYDERPEAFHRPEEVRASVIVLADARRAQALAREAQDAGPRAFRELVEAHSIDAKSRDRGGDLGHFTRDTEDLPDALIDAAFAADPLEVVGPVDSGEGTYFVIKRTGYREPVEHDFEDVTRQLRNRVYQQKRVDVQARFLEELRESTEIEIHDEALRRIEIPSGEAARAEPAQGSHLER